ncbi:hypothetical protein [Kangiella sediminilitoris]|uniref:Uncharacterized protein n=1 Tax=Kangiella sediminilitoris TaxID=1144748 RepID=A0A1B3BAC1_9GAMM|nr:hypothetical protein [Kangiella sediminilitoris]AOE49771.1 hypothetical protein KS2013_1051 [Kangiella sediminilitoris]
MNISFKQAEGFSVTPTMFIAGWKVWFKRFSDHPTQWKYAKMPLGESSDTLSALIRRKQRFSVEVLARMMVPWAYRNSSQVSLEFVETYSEWLELTSLSENDETSIDAVCLSDKAVKYWDSLAFVVQDDFMNYAEARVQADIEAPSSDPVVLDDQGIELIGEDTYPPYVPDADASDEEFIRALVQWIDDAPYQAYYLKQPSGDAVAGWDNRLSAFFWPKPRIGYTLYQAMIDPLYYRATELAKTVDAGGSWDKEWGEMAVKTAIELFDVSGTPQKGVTLDNVHKVIQTALAEDFDSSAKMNSGWSFLASAATSYLDGEEGRLPMVWWCSRVASSIISRLDFLLAEAGVESLDKRFPDIGTVPGYGGTRPRQYTLGWPEGYRSWKTQIAASNLVQEMVKVLNSERDKNGNRLYSRMPLANGSHGDWTVQGVQTVLFADGY